MITVKGESGVEGENKVAPRALASRAKNGILYLLRRNLRKLCLNLVWSRVLKKEVFTLTGVKCKVSHIVLCTKMLQS